MPDPSEEKEEDMGAFRDILQASAALDWEQRAWRVNTVDSMEREIADRRKTQESERKMYQDIMRLFRQQTQMTADSC
ncbi:unnamed protein product [Caretta caretta]